MTSLHEGFPHQLKLSKIESLEGQLEVAHTAMQQLCAAAAGSAADIPGFQDRNGQAAAYGFIGHARATGTSADHQEIAVVISHAS